jgi:hypothetical protein
MRKKSALFNLLPRPLGWARCVAQRTVGSSPGYKKATMQVHWPIWDQPTVTGMSVVWISSALLGV